jgi:cutinase
VIFARGTVSPGNMGNTVGPPFVEAIAAIVGNDSIAVQGIDYPASILGFLEGGDDDGSVLLANLTETAMIECPDTHVVVSGYR